MESTVVFHCAAEKEFFNESKEIDETPLLTFSSLTMSDKHHSALSSKIKAELPTNEDISAWVRKITVKSSASIPLINDVSFYLRKAQMCCLVGVSGAGKSVLLESIRGQSNASTLYVNGSVSIDNELTCLDGRRKSNIGVGFVSASDVLIGELTVRETFMSSVMMRTNKTYEECGVVVDSVIKGLSLEKVKDNVIGTVIKRGLSGGEKRRVSVGVELTAQPALVLLDEPTSGLDASTAYSVMQSIRDMCCHSNGRLTVLAALQQPNARILSLFSDLLMLNERGCLAYFGPMNMAMDYFASIGYPTPHNTTMTDHFLHVADTRFESTNINSNLCKKYRDSELFESVNALYLQSKIGKQHDKSSTTVALFSSSSTASGTLSTRARQLMELTRRNVQIATRDVTLYYLQFLLNSGFGFLVGALFYQLPHNIDARINDVSNAIVWLTFVGIYIHIFKVYFIVEMKKRYNAEHANGAFHTSMWSLSDFLVTSFFTFIMFIPGLVLAYLMIGLPAASIGYAIWLFFIMALCAESLCDFLSQFPSTTPVAILLSQGALVILCVFAGGSFIRWSKIGFWSWLSDISLFTWSTKGLMTSVAPHLTYYCPPTNYNAADNVCTFNSLVYACDGNGSNTAAQACYVKGTTVLSVLKGEEGGNEWVYSIIVLAFVAFFRVATYVLLRFPPRKFIRKMLTSITGKDVITGDSEIIDNDPIIIDMKRISVNPVVSATINTAQNTLVPENGDGHRPLALVWTDLQLKLKGSNKIIIDHLNGYATAGRVLAIMGGSGAGKTTMLNSLAGRAPYGIISGSVTLGGRQLATTDIDYVPQFDNLMPVLTCYESMLYMARLKTEDEEQVCIARSCELLKILGLEEKKEVKVFALSNAERKRLACGMALIGRPTVLFLDEPSTGLDSEAALVVTEYILNVCRSTNVVAVMTLHQPSSALFSKIDDLLLLTSGKCAYFGEVKYSEAHFNDIGYRVPPLTNPADFYLDLITSMPPFNNEQKNSIESDDSIILDTQYFVDVGNAWEALYQGSNTHKNMIDVTTVSDPLVSSASSFRPSEFYRFLYLVKHLMLRVYLIEPAMYFHRLFQLVLIGIFIGTLFLRLGNSISDAPEISGAMFFTVWVILFAGLSSTPVLVQDRTISENEYLNGAYTLATLHLAMFTASLPFHALISCIYTLLTWFMVLMMTVSNGYMYLS